MTDQNPSYQNIVGDHHAVNHSAYEYVRDMAHTNGIESFWATLKRAYKGTFHKLSHKHMSRYVNEFTGRHNVRDRDTLDQMATLTAAMVGKRIEYQALVDSPRNYPIFDPRLTGFRTRFNTCDNLPKTWIYSSLPPKETGRNRYLFHCVASSYRGVISKFGIQFDELGDRIRIVLEDMTNEHGMENHACDDVSVSLSSRLNEIDDRPNDFLHQLGEFHLH